jgi:hypothetical protein
MCLTHCDHEASIKRCTARGVASWWGENTELYGIIQKFTFTDVYLVGIFLIKTVKILPHVFY